MLEEHRDFVTAYVLYEKDADGRDARDLAELGGKVFWVDGTGRFSAAYNRNPAEPDRLVEQRTPAAEMETALSYDGLRRKVAGGSGERYLVTEPYRYSDRVLSVKQPSAIMVGGRFAGIAGVDRALDYLDALLRELRPFETARFYLLSGSGRVVAATLDQDIRTMRVADLRLDAEGKVAMEAYVEKAGMRELDEGRLAALVHGGARTDLATLLSSAKAGPGEPVVGEVTDPFDGRRAFLASSRVPTGGWTLVMTVSEKEVLAPIDRTIRRTLLSTGLGVAAVVVLLVLFARSLARRLGRAVGVARSVADGDLTARVEDSSLDEPGRLLRAIGEMTTSLGDLVGKVRQATDRLGTTANGMRASAQRQEGAVQDFSASTTEIAAALRRRPNEPPVPQRRDRGREGGSCRGGIRGGSPGDPPPGGPDGDRDARNREERRRDAGSGLRGARRDGPAFRRGGAGERRDRTADTTVGESAAGSGKTPPEDRFRDGRSLHPGAVCRSDHRHRRLARRGGAPGGPGDPGLPPREEEPERAVSLLRSEVARFTVQKGPAGGEPPPEP